MATSTSIFRLILVLLSLSVILTPQVTTKVWAESNATALFEPPPGRDAPRGGTAGGGSRPAGEACLSHPSAKSSSLTALVPGRHLGLTQSDRPNFFVYIPQTTAQTAEFSLFDERMNGIYQVSVPVSQAGLVSISLLDTAPSLVKDKPYYWTVALVCNPSDRTDDWVVGGWIERAEPSATLKQQLANATAVERVSIYAKQGFWYEALNTLVELQRTQPNHPVIATSWAELMKSVGLEPKGFTVPNAIAIQPME
ncbi:DUF928 domain-containing protein [Allocoleopsis franciscana]|uniref:DUF928 domain-containing protein n=1 Tax=Allocoleopsis franciscana PCC 7113 TaxID=1173027 RepID=K9WPM7_9CYAN|nr:DUF928 domain-containing protein [Allocoleopsis franciscana]AFZ21761.1 protein of unknown function (DUF928) [Allocoleopsis franciscana PCC 7113]